MTDVFLYPGEASPNDVRLSDPTVVRGAVTVDAQISALVDAPTVALSAAHGVAASIAASVPAPVVSLTASHGVAASITATVPAPVVVLSAAHGVAASITTAVPGPVVSLAAAHGVAASIAASVPAPVVALSAAHGVAASIAAVATPVVAMNAAHGVAASIAATVPAPVVALTAAHGIAASITASVPAPAVALTLAHGVAGSIAASVPAPIVALVAGHGVTAQLTAMVPAPAVGLTVLHDANLDGYYDGETTFNAPNLQIAASVPAPVVVLAAAHGVALAVAAAVPAPVAAMAAAHGAAASIGATVEAPAVGLSAAHGVALELGTLVPGPAVSMTGEALEPGPDLQITATVAAPTISITVILGTLYQADPARPAAPEGGTKSTSPETRAGISAAVAPPVVRMELTQAQAVSITATVDRPVVRVALEHSSPSYGHQVRPPLLELREVADRRPLPTPRASDTVLRMTARVQRIDQGTDAGKPQKLANGWLRVDALLTRTGVFTYFNADGTKRRELRLDEEVFAPSALKSFGLVPVTDQHPPDFLTAENTKEYARGAVGESPTREGKHVASSLLVTDAELIAKLESGEARELSCGYTCDLEMTPGEHAGEKYDAIQRRIVGNHVAVVTRGRAGATARVRMDSAAVAVVRLDPEPGGKPVDPPNNQEQRVKIIRIDGVDYEAGTDAFMQAFARLQTRLDTEKSDAVKALSVLQAKFDAQAEELSKLKTDIAEMPAKITSAAKVRAELETRARSVLGAKFKLDGLDTKSVRAAVLERLVKGIKLDGKTESYIEARFDAELERFAADGGTATDRTAAVRAAVEPVNEDTGEELPADSGGAFSRMVTDSQNAWETTLKSKS